MGKPLTQITFEFSAAEEKEPLADGPVVDIALPAEKKEKAAETNAVPPKTAPGRGRRSLKDAGMNADLVQVPDDEILFQKQYYSIGEVAAMFNEKQSLIRYWETEFDLLQPRKNRKGDRFFRPVDVKNLVLIHDLLRRRKFTLEGAREYLKKNNKADDKFAMIQSLEKIKAFLLELKANL